MKLYHLDREGSLRDNTAITLHPISELNPDIRTSILFESFPHGVSQHCIHMTSIDVPAIPPTQVKFGDIYRNFWDVNTISHQVERFNSQLIDFTFELIRQAKFPDMPSRFTSLFAVKKISDFALWPELVRGRSADFQIFEIDVPESTPRFDVSFLRGGVIFNSNKSNNYYMGFSPTGSYDLACKYWSGEISDHPRFEYLIPLPIDASAVHKVDLTKYDMEAVHQPTNDEPLHRFPAD